MVNLLVAAAIAAAPMTSAPDAAQNRDEPAMYVVRDADTTVYIFGTFHALDGHGDWLNPRVRSAFESSNELVLETLIPEGAAPAAALPPRPLPVPLAPSASFLATTRMTIDAGKSQGMQLGNGADMVLRHIAEQEGKPVEGLETLESQFAMFSRLPSAPKSAGLVPGAPVDATPMESLSKALAEMQSAWKRGDQSVFVNMLAQLDQASPTTYRMLFTDRSEE